MRTLFCLLLTAAAASAAKPPQSTLAAAKPAQVTLHDTLGDRPPYDAPAGREWRRYDGKPWELYPVAPAVAMQLPFPVSGVGDYIKATPVRPAAGPSSSFPVVTPTAPTIMYALPTAPYGAINCVGSG